MNEILFATGNSNKSREVRNMLRSTDFRILDLSDIGFEGELLEEEETLEGNALSKVRQALQIPNISRCFAEDTGLEVEILNGRPGVYSARFAGPQKDNEANMAKLLEMMEGEENRNAQFRTVLAYKDENIEIEFEGIVKGTIARGKSGNKGFGYDPVFIPEGHTQTFGELDSTVKNAISHRARALQKFIQWLTGNKKE